MNNKILQSLFAYTLCLMAMVTLTYSQSSLQVTGSFPKMDGGFEGQTAGSLRIITGFKDSIFTDWTVNTGPASIVNVHRAKNHEI